MVKGISSTLKWKRKRWYNIIAPETFGETVIGQTPAMNPEDIKGRRIKINGLILLKDPKKQSRILTFRIDEVKGDKAYTKTNLYEIPQPLIKKLVRKKSSRINSIIKNETIDKKLIEVKTILVTTAKCQAEVRKQLKNKTDEIIKKEISKNTHDNFLLQVLDTKIQKDLKKSLKRIHPVRSVEIIKTKALN